jgi:hypothetical protein
MCRSIKLPKNYRLISSILKLYLMALSSINVPPLHNFTPIIKSIKIRCRKKLATTKLWARKKYGFC